MKFLSLITLLLLLTSCGNSVMEKEIETPDINSEIEEGVFEQEENDVITEEADSYPVNDILNYSILMINHINFYNDSTISNYIISEFLKESEMVESLLKIKSLKGLFPSEDITNGVVKDLIEIPDIKIGDLIKPPSDTPIMDKDKLTQLKDNYKTISLSIPVISGGEKSAIIVMKQVYKEEEKQWVLLFVKDDNKWNIDLVFGTDNDDIYEYKKIGKPSLDID